MTEPIGLPLLLKPLSLMTMFLSDINRAVHLVAKILWKLQTLPSSNLQAFQENIADPSGMNANLQKSMVICRPYPATSKYTAYKQARACAKNIRESWVNYVSGFTSDPSNKQL